MRARCKTVFYTESGSAEKQTYVAVQMTDGTFNLVEGEMVDIQEEIDSHAESCSIEHIIALCAAGDTSALNRVQGSFIDTTLFPESYAECLQLVIKGRSEFDRLPLEVRQKFDQDFVSWFQTAGTEEWIEKMGLSYEAPEQLTPIPVDPKPGS